MANGRDHRIVLRAARLLLVASAAAAVGDVVVIVSRARTFAPVVFVFIVAAALFVAAARALEGDRRRGRLLAWAGAAALAGIGTLAGFGAGDVTFPAAALGVVAAWLTLLVPWSRRIALLFTVYLVAGLALFAPRLVGLLAFPWLLPSVLIWPITLGLPLGGGIFTIYLSFGAALALTAVAFAPRTRGLAPPTATSWRLALIAGVGGGLALVALLVVLALARPNTSARFELGAVPLVLAFVAGALAASGALLVRGRVPGALVVALLGGAAVVYILSSRPTVECAANGAGTSPSGPWWMPYYGSVSTSGGTSSLGPGAGATVSSGAIRRGDGVTITYRCVGAQLVEFAITR